jgi:hypothetical protein
MSLALVLAPAVATAQVEPPAGPAGAPAITLQQRAAMQLMHSQLQAAHVQTRARVLAALTPAHRTAVANVFGQLALSPNPNPRAAAQALDAMLAPAEKLSIINIAAAERANMKTLMEQQRAAFESTMTADERARMTQREAQRQAFMASHPRAARVPDAGAIVLRTLGGGFGGGPGGMHDDLI